MALNTIQKEILDGFLQFPISECAELKPDNALSVLKAMVSQDMDSDTQIMLQSLDMESTVKQIRDILAHPCPQNRNSGDPTAASGSENGVRQGEVYYWVGGFGGQLRHEPQGVLGLTAKNDNQTEAVTKNDVLTYLKHSLYNEIYKYSRKLGLIDWDYWTSPAHTGNPNLFDPQRERYYLNCNNISLSIEADRVLGKKDDKHCMPNLNNLTIINVIVKDQDTINMIKQKLDHDQPTFIKRVISGDCKRSCKVELDESGFLGFAFYGKDPAMEKLLEILNKYVFDEKIPHYLLNNLRNNAGLDLLPYSDNVSVASEEKNTATKAKSGP